MSNEPKDVQFGDPELMQGPIEEAPRVAGNASSNHWDCDGPCMVIEDVTGDDIIAKQDADEMPKPKFDCEAINKYQQEQRAKGQCAIGVYVLGLHCTQPAKDGWGYGSIIHACDIHSTWNPFMLEGGKCPACGKLADHYPCNVCPGCGMTVDANNTATRPDGTILCGNDGKPVRIYHGSCEPATEMFTIEFELYGTEGKRWAVCYGENPHNAIRNFLHVYPSTQGTIVSIRVPEVAV